VCGIFGIYGNKDAAQLTYLGLYALQHRGEESAGIISYNGRIVHHHKGMGQVGDLFDETIIKFLKGNIAVGHVRYSTTGSSNPKNIQPFVVNHRKQNIVISHNGNLLNTVSLHNELEREGSIFQTTMDSEIIAHLLVKSKEEDLTKQVTLSLARLRGAYSLVMMINGTLVGARDPFGWRPLCLGKLNGAYVLASETCALDLIQAEYIRDIEPGEIIFISKKGLKSVKPFEVKKHALCIFEYIYFARPDSNIFGKSVYLSRERLGRELAREHPVNCDIVMPIPDSGSYAAVGFTKESGMPYEMGIIRNHYVGRTFIQPSQHIRDFRVRVKLNPIKDVLRNKRIAVIDDSIVRGTTTRTRIKALRKAGAKEVHMRISCPPLRYPCFFGIDFPTKKELIASNKTIKQMQDFMGLDSLKYLSLEGMLKAMLLPKEEFCTACFTGDYPLKFPKNISKYNLEK
jgi:amidophosphoribosyltransferase